MVAVAKPPYITPQEYLERERAAEFKSEYCEGVIYAMSGASVAHNRISANVTGGLWLQFRGRSCQVFSNDLKVCVENSGLYAYPDVVALCGEPQLHDRQQDVLLNPELIVEVLSPTTEAYDRGKKFNYYQQIATLTDYVLISQDRICVERYQRQTDGSWRYTSHENAEEVIHFAGLECELRLADIYDKVEFPVRMEADAQQGDAPA
jgi:Uma2 family endonuclease